MNILMASILDTYHDINGVTVSIKELKEGLTKINHQTKLITPYLKQENCILFRLIQLIYKVYTILPVSFLMLIILMLKGLILYNQMSKMKTQYNFIHTHDVISAYAALKAVKGRTPIAMSVHFFDYPWREFVSAGLINRLSLSYIILRLFSISVLKNDYLHLFFVSESNRRFVERLGINVRNHSIVIYPGVDEYNIFSQQTNEAGYIINVGSLDRRKNQIAMVDIAAELKKLGMNICFMHIGPEDEQEKRRLMSRIHKLGLKNMFRFMGKQNIETTRKFIRNAALYFHTSKLESFGITLIEAMSLGTPVIALAYDAAYEILDDKSILNPQLKPNQIAAHIAGLLENERELKQVEEYQKRIFNERFTRKQMLNKYLDYTQKLIKREEIY